MDVRLFRQRCRSRIDDHEHRAAALRFADVRHEVNARRRGIAAPDDDQPRVFEVLSAAKALRKADVRVTIIDRHNHHLFQPLLYQVATATLSPGDIASPIRWILRKQRNTRVLLGDVSAIDLQARRVTLVDGAVVDYDYLIVATGASHTYFGHDEWAAHAPGLKTLEDALEIRRRVLTAFERAERESDPVKRGAW